MLDHLDAPELPADRVLAAVLAVRDSIRLSDGRYPNMTVSLSVPSRPVSICVVSLH